MKTGGLKRFGPVVGLAGLAVLFFALDLDRFLRLQTLADNREALLAWVAANRLPAVLAYMAIYALAIVCLPPSGTLLTLTGGFLFGGLAGGMCAVVGATLGASGLFVVARTALGDSLRNRAGPRLRQMEAGFRDNALSYLLVLRLVPLFPFWLVNLAPALLGVRLPTFVIATALGIVPGTLVYAYAGNGLGAVLDAGGEPDPGIVLSPPVLLPLLGLALLALVPVLYKRRRAGQRAASGPAPQDPTQDPGS